jgi:hypothetical protein
VRYNMIDVLAIAKTPTSIKASHASATSFLADAVKT